MCPLPIICRYNPVTGRPMQFHVCTPRAPPRVEYIPIWVTLNPHFVSKIVIFEYLHREPPFDVSARHLLCWETWMSPLYLLSLLPRNGTHGDTAGGGVSGMDCALVGCGCGILRATVINDRHDSMYNEADRAKGGFGMTYWLNTYMTPVVLHKDTCYHVKKEATAHPDHWTEYPTKDAAEAAGRSTLRRVQECGTCF